jgi:hypothetical protein|tara:strand:- start:172 stop:441 length:270 start_codon:yes stop_codon:yes gene_type:complete
MITAVVIIAYVCLFLFGVGTVLAFFSSWRAGCLGKDLAEVKTGLAWVFLRIKNFAHRIFNRSVHRHVTQYYMYYGLIMMFMILILQHNI